MLRIKEWDDHFEKNRTRELKYMGWVPVPNRHDGRGYTALVDHPNGAAHLGAWLAILQIASRQKKGRRGQIPQDGAGMSQCLARMSHLPAVIFDEALPRLIEIGWIECFHEDGEIPHDDAEIPHLPAASCAGAVRNGTEGKGTELNGTGEILPARIVVEAVRSFVIDAEELEEAWEQHQKFSGREPRDLAFRRIFGMNGKFNAQKFRDNHPRWCEYWARHGWNAYGSLTFLEWIEVGMPLPPPETSPRAGNARQQAIDKAWEEA